MEEDYDVFGPGDDMADYEPLARHQSMRNELSEDKIRSFYRSIEQDPPEVLDPNDFEMRGDHLYVKKEQGESVRLTTKPDPSKFLKKSTLRNRLSVSDQRRLNILTVSELRHDAISALQSTLQELPTDPQIQNIPLLDLSRTADQLVHEMETSLTEETALKTIDDPPLPMREIMALNESLRTIRGELTNNLAKLSELDEHIRREKQKLAEADDANLGQDVKDRIKQRLRDLEQERSARLEVLSTNREDLRTQANRLRETIHTILYENTTLAERIRTLFREQGITIASILTAIGFAISTIVQAVTGGSGSGSGGGSQPPSDKSWVKKQLEHLSNLLKTLASKALDALPGIIGAIVSWIFTVTSKVVGFMADHLWTLLLLVVGLNKIKTN